MSIMVMSRMFKASLGSSSRKIMAVRLADFADDEGRGIWPTVARLARETELSERTVQRILADFVAEGLLVVVQEASGKPGQATRYDFDLAAIARLGQDRHTGDVMSPVAGALTGDTMTETGDTDDEDGCHHDTRTVIEPPVEPSLEREGASASANGEENSRSVIRKFDKWWPSYPDYAGTSRDAALKEWFALTADERADCIARTPAFIKATKDAKGSFVYPSVYLKERKWTLLDDPRSDVAPAAMYNPFSRAWMALRLAELSKPMTSEGWPAPSAFQRTLMRDADKAAEIKRERRARYGWPKVTAMDAKVENRFGAFVPGPLLVVSEGFQKMHRDSAEAAAWKALHERMGWPWLPATGHEWLYFPAGQPEEAMAEFQALVKGETHEAAV
ncbi:helix-turn-helix domain-containing protein [Rhizobium halophytocola]|uniref:Helix-turn-helix domain-containing protein n=1 Tax=Rhizobium halophytocola TaxID=735519 RepID=A0ABS4DXV9_9HYPH|nr:helix-turn-helix domain-containing protein [Rhizobium halophytocola]MBP1850524.1 hypothetical protein [Rhizobium halophytocola]